MKTSLVRIVLPAVLLLLSGAPLARAGDLQGAAAALAQIAERGGSADSPGQKADPARQLRDDLASYSDRSAGLPPEEAARDWLALYDRAAKLPAPETPPYGGSASLPAEVLQAMPPPPVWDALCAQIAARPAGDPEDRAASVLRVFGGMLASQPSTVSEAIAGLKKAAPAQSWRGLRNAFLDLTADRAGILQAFEVEVGELEHSATSGGDASELSNTFTVPDLVALGGHEKAGALLKRLFALPLQNPSFRGKATEALARKVALEMGDQLRATPWELVNDLDSAALFELLSKRTNGSGNTVPSDAAAYHLLGLVVHGKTEEAATAAEHLSVKLRERESSQSLPEYALRELTEKGYAAEVAGFFRKLLAAHPELPYWRTYIEAATNVGDTETMFADLQSARARTDLSAPTQKRLLNAYGEALLAADRVPEGVAVLKDAASAPAEEGDQRQRNSEQVEAYLHLATIAHLTGDDALLNEQLDAVTKLAIVNPAALSTYNPPVKLFLAAGRGSNYERILIERAARAAKRSAQRRTQMGGYVPNDLVSYATLQQPLSSLTDLYFRTGRYEDIVTLLDRAPDWGTNDLAAVLDPESSLGQSELGLQVARTLQKTGRPEAALPIVNACLERNGGSDPGYALLLDLLPPDKAEARLNELFAADQFEERPLIWKAFLQLGQGRVDEAEKSARAAIAIDPSDGEEGRGDRMRAYAVLGDILERKGDTEKAGQMRQAVKAIRLSEDADQFHSAGLLTRAIGMYKKALGYFSDAYCIQSRLAIQLTALGRFDEAMAHYQRAYELMPESFGRMESHCFGCERAFAGERPQSAAEKVFGRLVVKQRDNPHVHYLLGYLRMEQDRNAEAAREFREAVRLDPDYINAWKQLAQTTDLPADRSRAALNLLRLDPQRRHDAANLSQVDDLRALWAAVGVAAKFTPPRVEKLYPLGASAAVLEKRRAEHPLSGEQQEAMKMLAMQRRRGYLQRGTVVEPRPAVLENEVLAAALTLLSDGNSVGTD